MDWSKEAITFSAAEKKGKSLGYYYTRKMGLGPELWKIEVYEVNGKLYGGDRLEGRLEPMLESARKEILETIKEEKQCDSI